jgi:hypothetical protein
MEIKVVFQYFFYRAFDRQEQTKLNYEMYALRRIFKRKGLLKWKMKNVVFIYSERTS